ncbi:MAG: transposase domain-containing protein [Clostridia bacterium]|nr:transposase domain-containing protein [Clostridia bacterium]
METAKANGLNPEKYISHLLTVLPERFAKDPKAAAHDLLPWADDVQRLCRG